MPIYAFEFETASDLLSKARRELERLKAAQSNAAENDFVSDHGFNCAITLWHIIDWLWRDQRTNKQLKTSGFMEFKDLRSSLHKNYHALSVCDEIANGAKHMVLNSSRWPSPKIIDSDVSASGTTFMATGLKVLKIELVSGERQRADEIFNTAIKDWENFFTQYQIS